MRILEGFLLLLAAAAVAATAWLTPPPKPLAPVETHPAIDYGGGRVTLNDRCPVRKVRLNVAMEPLWVNGHPVGFC